MGKGCPSISGAWWCPWCRMNSTTCIRACCIVFQMLFIVDRHVLSETGEQSQGAVLYSLEDGDVSGYLPAPAPTPQIRRER